MRILFFIIFFAFINTLIIAQCDVNDEFLQKFKNSVDNDLTEDDFFNLHQMILMSQYNSIFRTQDGIKDCPDYKSDMTKLIESDSKFKRALAYTVLWQFPDSSFYNILLTNLDIEQFNLPLTWLISAIMSNKIYEGYDKIFNYLAKASNEAMPILINMFFEQNPELIIKVCRPHLGDDDYRTKVLAMQFISHFGPDPEAKKIAMQIIENGDEKYVGYAIVALELQGTGNLKKLLEPFVADEKLKYTIISALENSPTLEDNEYAKEIRSKMDK